MELMTSVGIVGKVTASSGDFALFVKLKDQFHQSNASPVHEIDALHQSFAVRLFSKVCENQLSCLCPRHAPVDIPVNTLLQSKLKVWNLSKSDFGGDSDEGYDFD